MIDNPFQCKTPSHRAARALATVEINGHDRLASALAGMGRTALAMPFIGPSAARTPLFFASQSTAAMRSCCRSDPIVKVASDKWSLEHNPERRIKRMPITRSWIRAGTPTSKPTSCCVRSQQEAFASTSIRLAAAKLPCKLIQAFRGHVYSSEQLQAIHSQLASTVHSSPASQSPHRDVSFWTPIRPMWGVPRQHFDGPWPFEKLGRPNGIDSTTLTRFTASNR